jgi:hypothetical protein
MNLFTTSSLELYTGADEFINYQATDDTGTVPVNISGSTFALILKSYPLYADASASLYITQTTFSNAANGQLSFPIPAASTANLTAGKYYGNIVDLTPEVGHFKSVVLSGC